MGSDRQWRDRLFTQSADCSCKNSSSTGAIKLPLITFKVFPVLRETRSTAK